MKTKDIIKMQQIKLFILNTGLIFLLKDLK